MGKKQLRQNAIKEIILRSGFKPRTKDLAERFGVTERTIQTDINEIADEITDVKIESIFQALLDRLNERTHDVDRMSNRDLILLAEFFMSKKRETRVEAQGEINLTVRRSKEVEEMLERYAELFEDEADADDENERSTAG